MRTGLIKAPRKKPLQYHYRQRAIQRGPTHVLISRQQPGGTRHQQPDQQLPITPPREVEGFARRSFSARRAISGLKSSSPASIA